MKRFFSILLVTALLIGLTPLVASIAQAEEYATVISDNGYGVRLREGPSKTYNVIKVYEVGTTVIVQQKGLEWSQLLIGDTVGWMMNQYLNFGSVGNYVSNGTITGVGNATVISDNGLRVWLRTRPSGTRIRLYSPGTAVTVLQRGDTWSQISIGGTIGYMMSRYLSFETTPVPAPGSKQVTAVSVNYPDPLAGDTLEAKVTPEDATVTYSWKVDGVEQSTDKTLVVLSRYAGAKIQLTVKGTGVYTGTATYTTSEVVTAKWVSGVQLSKSEPYVGDTLTAVLKPSSAKVIYSWRVGGVEVGTEASYTVQESDIGKLIQLKVTGTDGFSGSAACSATANVLSNKVVNAAIINNTQPIPGDVLSYTVQPAGATTSCVWKADGETVATVASYKVQQKDIGKVITVTVTGTGDYSGSAIGSTAKVTSARLASVKIGNTSPVDGQTIYAVPSPSTATASYTWYANGVELGTYSTPDFEVPEEAVGKTLTVTAVGTGAYTGTATSAATNKVVSSKKITSVTLSNTTPVVGDTISVTIKPATANTASAKNQHSYVWTIGNKTVSGTGLSTYKVEAADAGLTIRVRVVGVSPYSGDVYSAYTSAVASSSKLTGVSLKNNDTGANAASVSPEVGHTLKAVVSPSQAQTNGAVKYTWKVGGVAVASATSDTFVVPANAVGKQISVTVQGTGNYKGDGKTTYTATSAKAVQYKKLSIALKFAAPKEGNIPTYNVSVDKQYSAKIVWLDETGNTAKLDEAGAFLPGTTYVAKVTVTPASGYTMVGVTTATAAGAKKVEVKGSVITCTYPATASQQVNDYYITCISRPVPGQTQATSFTDTQYDGVIDWSDKSDTKGNIVYTAKITLTSKDGYVFDGVPANVFEVGGADSVTSEAGSGNTLSLTATYKITPTVVISADSTQVALDGINRKVISLSAELTNYYEPAANVEWSVTGATTDATSMTSASQIGKLIVGANETVDRDLIVHAKVTTANGGSFTGTLNIHLISGSVESNAISVIFNKAPVNAKYGETVQFEAMAVNSVLGVTWSVYPNDVSSINAESGLLTIPENETAKQLVVTATSIEDPSKTSNFLISLQSPVKVNISPEAVTLNVNQQVEFKATVTGTENPSVKWSMSGNTSAETTITPNGLTCTLNLAYDEAADQIKLQAVTEEGVASTATVTVNKTALLTMALDAEADLATLSVDDIAALETENVTDSEAMTEPETSAGAENTQVTISISSMQSPMLAAPAQIPAEKPDEEEEQDLDLTVEEDSTKAEETETDKTEEPKQDEPQEENEDESSVGMIVITNEDGTVDSTTSLGLTNEEEKEPVEDAKNAQAAPVNSDVSEDAAAATKAEATEAELIALEEEKDDLDSDENVGESQKNDRDITISFVKKVDSLKRGAFGVFEVSVSGSDEGVLWRVYHGGSSEEGVRYSTIKSDGLSATLTIGADETSSRLTVAAISREDNTILARWIITISNPAGTKTTTNGTVTTSPIVETGVPTVEGTSPTIVPGENANTDEDEARMAEEALKEENKDLTEEEQKEQDTLNMF